MNKIRNNNSTASIKNFRGKNGHNTAPVRNPENRTGDTSRSERKVKELESFAFLGSRAGFVHALAAKAAPERWDFPNEPKDLYILRRYINITFKRLQDENKICISSDDRLAAFNTGLVDEYFNDIYACFERNTNPDGLKWKFADFCVAGKGIGKKLVECFSPLPEPARYIKSGEDTVYDVSKPLFLNYDHIIIDNIDRLPLPFLEQISGSCSTEALELTAKIRACESGSGRESLYGLLREAVRNNTKLYMSIKNGLDNAIELSKKRIRMNFRNAVPCYSPKDNKMSIMLPLFIMDNGKPDLALVVRKTDSGSFQGYTAFTLKQAYVNARLIFSGIEGWLSMEKVFSNSSAKAFRQPARTVVGAELSA